ncbi:MAG: S41 family peptidase, partial [Myxococcota bacterium]|nr:S41 family peptidase [Myxococcota bacterium]
LTIIEARHVDSIPTNALIDHAIRGMTHGLDGHSTYLDSDTYTALRDRTEALSSGCGVDVQALEGTLVISRIVPKGPAAIGGLQVGDVLLELGGASTGSWSPDQARQALRGEPGTTVDLVVERDDQQFEYTLVRDTIREIAVSGALFEPGWAYVELGHFHRNVTHDFVQLIDELSLQGEEAVQGIILDLRGNPGGLLDEAIALVDHFVEDAVIAESISRNSVNNEQFHATPGAWPGTVVVIVDSHSASASELFAGAMQALGRAKLVGRSTRGKVSVQQMFEFEDGSALKLTVARYRLPGGTTLQDNRGLTPDVLVQTEGGSAQLQALWTDISNLPVHPQTREGLLRQLETLGGRSEEPKPQDLQARIAWDSTLEIAWNHARQTR